MSKKEPKDKTDISRRSFLKGVGIASIGAAVGVGTQSIGAEEPTSEILGPDKAKFTLRINGKDVVVEAEPRQTLVEVLRDHLQMTGTKISCDRGACGACTVIMDGKTVPSCMTLAIDAVGSHLETIEGLEHGGKLHDVQQSFIDHDALQCGFCTPGMVMSCKNLLDQNSKPNLDDIKLAVSGNLCRCGTYPKVFQAVSALKGKGE